LISATSSNNDGIKDVNSNHSNGDSKKEFATTYRILAVDDDPDILLAFKKGLEEQAHMSKFGGTKMQVDTYANPKQALSSFKAGVYDLLLIDIRMPDINGFELYRELNKIDARPKVCFITAYELYYDALKKDFPGLDTGCFIKKPISIEDLAVKIREELA
jgi:two-component system, OmpR family, response regulator ChvI